MGLPPPRLRNLTSMLKTSSSCDTEERKVWEIGVPSKNSLYWSVVLSYMLSCDDDRFSKFIDDLKRNETTAGKMKGNYLSANVDFRDIKKRLHNFNPFKNRHVFSYDILILKVFVTFKIKLKQYANKMMSKESEWSDEFKLNAASSMLDCRINVFFPEEKGQKFVSYLKQISKHRFPTIVLFQYKNQKHGSRTESINVFHFAMTVDHAYSLKLCALLHILKKAKISVVDTGNIQQLMHNIEAHGKNFLSTVLQSPQFYILPCLYKSPYIALKLSEAGFETNPTAYDSSKPSAFLHAATKTDIKYIRILYDYAANCRYLFQNTVRDPNETVLESLKILHGIFVNDRSKIQISNYNTHTKERALSIQSELSRFNEYQQNVAASVINVKRKLSNTSPVLEVLPTRKKFVQIILKSYIKHFYYDSPKSNISDIYDSYLNFNEYYENIDSFTCLSFFDYIHLLKKIFQMDDVNIASVESTFFLLMMSNRYFPKFEHNAECSSDNCESNCEADKNVLRFIPFLYREDLKKEVDDFLNKFKKYPVLRHKIKQENLCCSLSVFPEIRDELLISRVGKYLKAAIDVSFDEDGIKGILVIERTLQVLGESVKPQSTEGCVVSCLLGARLPMKLKKELINIRNDLSHYKDNSTQGRLTIEANSKFFGDLQKELKIIGTAFEIVAFTQYLRLEETLIENSKKKLEIQQFDENIVTKFSEFKMKIGDRRRNYTAHHNECIKLSLDIMNDLTIKYTEFINLLKDKKNSKTVESNISSILKSIEYVLMCLCKMIDKDVFEPHLQEMQSIYEKYKYYKKIDTLISDILPFLQKYEEIVNEKYKIVGVSHSDLQFPALESFFNSLKQNDISESDIIVIVKAAKDSYIEATKAKDDLITYIENGCICLTELEEDLTKKFLISDESLRKLKNYLELKDKKLCLKELNKKWISINDIEMKIRKMFQNNSVENGDVKTLLIKMVYQRNLKTKIYTSVKFTEALYDKLEKFFTKKVNFLLNRIESLKSVLIDENEEISEGWKWGRSVEIKHHVKFLMRQRYLREMTVRAALEMALLDCLNILLRKEFVEFYEKLNYLFTGINLRDVLSHGHSILETIGGLLDEDDLPSELINKMLELIDDYEVITTIRDLIPCSGTLEMECFKTWIENNKDEALEVSIKKINRCSTWTNYLFLFPLI